MPERQNVRTVKTTALQGSDSWLKYRPVTVKEADHMAELQRQKMALRYNPGESDEEDDEIEQEWRALDREIMDVIASALLDWNWVDNDGKPLAKPNGNADVLNELTMAELAFVGECIHGGENGQKKDRKRSKRPAR